MIKDTAPDNKNNKGTNADVLQASIGAINAPPSTKATTAQPTPTPTNNVDNN